MMEAGVVYELVWEPRYNRIQACMRFSPHPTPIGEGLPNSPTNPAPIVQSTRGRNQSTRTHKGGWWEPPHQLAALQGAAHAQHRWCSTGRGCRAGWRVLERRKKQPTWMWIETKAERKKKREEDRRRSLSRIDNRTKRLSILSVQIRTDGRGLGWGGARQTIRRFETEEWCRPRPLGWPCI